MLLFGVLFVAVLLWSLWPWLREREGSSGLTLKGAASLALFALLALLLWRLGRQGLAVAAGLLWVFVQRLLPLLRLWPVFHTLRGGAPPGSGPARSRTPGGASQGAARPDRGMTRQQALAVLGLADGASRDDIEREYRRLIKQVHPDRGGSNYLASQVNEARRVLLAGP